MGSVYGSRYQRFEKDLGGSVAPPSSGLGSGVAGLGFQIRGCRAVATANLRS